MKKFIKILLSIIILFILASPVLALEPIVKDDGLNGKYADGSYELIDFVVLLINISNWILAVSGAAALLAFVIGGLMFLVSGGSPDRVAAGKNWLKGAIIGLLIVFTSYMIINFIMTNIFGLENTTWYKVQK